MTKKIFCDLIKADVPTMNGNVYSQEALEQIVSLTNKQAENRQCFVTKAPPDDGRMTLDNVVGVVRQATIEDQKMACDVDMIRHDFDWLMEHSTIAPVCYGVTTDGVVEARSLQILGWTFVDNRLKDREK